MNHTRSGQAKHPAGFTLIEAMVVVAIVAILASVALPPYQEYVRRGKRVEARAGLLQASQWLERVATATGTYLKADADFPGALRKVPSNAYLISFKTKDAQGSGYTLQAIPQGGQAGDPCGTYTLDQTGARGLADTSPSDPLVAECWNR